MSFTSRVLLGLVAGLGLGAWIAAAGSPGVREAALSVEPAGMLWTRAIQMTVLPLTVGAASVLLPFSVPGIPGGFVLVAAPILLAVGLPAEGIGILLGVDTLPDMFRTATNATGHMAAATVLGGRRRGVRAEAA
jgi:Na+/H+-dicarboxylate symporter